MAIKYVVAEYERDVIFPYEVATNYAETCSKTFESGAIRRAFHDDCAQVIRVAMKEKAAP